MDVEVGSLLFEPLRFLAARKEKNFLNNVALESQDNSQQEIADAALESLAIYLLHSDIRCCMNLRHNIMDKRQAQVTPVDNGNWRNMGLNYEAF
jgi:hypothetical protein